MPNHVATTLTVKGDPKIIQKFLKKHFTTEKGERFLDFNTITPCHKDLYETQSPNYTDKNIQDILTNESMSEKNKKEHIAKIKAVMKKSAENKKKYGYANWYDFCVSEWGTKWGAYDCYPVDVSDENLYVLNYNTAWSPAVPIFKKLAKMYPELEFENVCLDEGWGFACRFICKGDEYEEEVATGETAIAKFQNKYMGCQLVKCKKCKSWYNSDNGTCDNCE